MAPEKVEDTTVSTEATAKAPTKKAEGIRKNGKQWHDPSTRRAFRPGSSSNPNARSSAFAKRQVIREQEAATKAVQAEMKAEKEADRKAHIDRILTRRKEKEEKERQRIVEEKMSVRRRERLKRKEKRNKLLNS